MLTSELLLPVLLMQARARNMKSAALLVAVALLGASVGEYISSVVPAIAVEVVALGVYCLAYRSASHTHGLLLCVNP